MTDIPDPIDPAPNAGSEEYVLACCFQDRALIARIEPQHFNTHRALAHALRHADSQGIPPTLDALIPALTKQQLADIGGLPTLLQLTDPLRFSTTTDFDYHVQQLARAEANARARELAHRILESADPAALLPSAPARTPIPARGLFDFKLPLDGDTSILLGDRYLNRGDGAVIVSSSGMGKSAMTLQMATELALHRGPFGIRGNGPLSSLIIQSEDSDGDVAEVAYSLKHVLQLTAADEATVQQRVKIVTDRVNRGLAFIASLRHLIDLHKPDLVWINPLQAFIDGDVTDSQDLGAFLRTGLNSLNQPARFGYVIVHHTTKPATGKDRAERLWHEVMYDMAGGAEIINWARAIISLRPTADEGDFNLVLAKRGRRAGVTRAVPNGVGTILEPVTTIPVRHAKGRLTVPGISRGVPLIHWEGRPATDDTPSDHGRKGGRPTAHDFDTYANLVPGPTEQPLTVPQLARRFKDECPIKEASLYNCVKRWVKEGLIIAIQTTGKPTTYRKPGSADLPKD